MKTLSSLVKLFVKIASEKRDCKGALVSIVEEFARLGILSDKDQKETINSIHKTSEGTCEYTMNELNEIIKDFSLNTKAYEFDRSIDETLKKYELNLDDKVLGPYKKNYGKYTEIKLFDLVMSPEHSSKVMKEYASSAYSLIWTLKNDTDFLDMGGEVGLLDEGFLKEIESNSDEIESNLFTSLSNVLLGLNDPKMED